MEDPHTSNLTWYGHVTRGTVVTSFLPALGHLFHESRQSFLYDPSLQAPSKMFAVDFAPEPSALRAEDISNTRQSEGQLEQVILALRDMLNDGKEAVIIHASFPTAYGPLLIYTVFEPALHL
jgi:hypothetical protein